MSQGNEAPMEDKPTKEAKTVKKEASYSKTAILSCQKYAKYKYMLAGVLDDAKAYTDKEIEALISAPKKQEVS